MSRRVWMLAGAVAGAAALSAALFATAAGQNGPPDDRGKPSGVPASIQITPDPIAIQCDGIDASTITVRVTDGRGKAVPDGTEVYFDTQYGFVDQVVVETKRGEASTQAHLYEYARNYPGVAAVEIVVGDLRASIRLDCAPSTDPCGPNASPPCPTPTPPIICEGGLTSPPCPIICGPGPDSPPCPTPTPPIICEGGPMSPPCPIICDGGPTSPPCPTPTLPSCWPTSPPGCQPFGTPTPTRTPSNTSVFFAVDADLNTEGIQSSRPTSVPVGQNFTVDVVLFGDVIPDYLAYQVTVDYSDVPFDVVLPASWLSQPVVDVVSGTPPGTDIWPSGNICDPSPTTGSLTSEDDSGTATLSMTCADLVFGELSTYRGTLLTLVFRCEANGAGTFTLHGIDDTFLLDIAINQFNDGVAHGSVACGNALPPSTPTPTATPTPSGIGLRPFIIPPATPTPTDNVDGRGRKRL